MQETAIGGSPGDLIFLASIVASFSVMPDAYSAACAAAARSVGSLPATVVRTM